MIITAPTLLVDREKCIRNIRMMKQKADSSGAELRPHYKTHQSGNIADWFRKEGITGATVSSLTMAEYFINRGWTDLTLAMPFNILETGYINKLIQKAELRLLITHEHTIRHLHRHLKSLVAVYIEIDTGAGRTGIAADQHETLDKLVALVRQSEMLRLKGFYSHPGHSYQARSESEILDLHAEVLFKMLGLKDRYGSVDTEPTVCIGDTPCCSVADSFEGVDELSPGNFIFYDLMQVQIGSCSPDQIATVLICPVIYKNNSRRELVVHGGAVHLSKDRLHNGALTHYGLPVPLDRNYHWHQPLEGCHVSALSQEHGTIRCTKQVFDRYEIGDLIGILPVHSCLTADLMGGYIDRNGTKLNHLRS